MTVFQWIVLATALGGVLSVLVAGVFLLLPEKRRAALLPHLISFATGALLGAALLELLPQAIAGAGSANTQWVGLALVAGIFAFFILEKLVLWRHCHQEDCEPHSHALTPTDAHRAKASVALILVGDSIHNALDGVLIAAAFMTDISLGIVTAVAVVTHEIPQEVGDFAIFLHSGMSRGRALALNLLSSLTAVVGGLVAYGALRHALTALPYVVAVAAACFLYVAVADLIPGLHRRVAPRESAWQVVLIAAGIGLIVLVHH